MKIVRRYRELHRIQEPVDGEIASTYVDIGGIGSILLLYIFDAKHNVWKSKPSYKDINYTPVFWFQEEEDATLPL